jgi:hypothetical protein
MATITFDTLKFANKLKSAGIAPEHAEAEAAALADVFETHLDELATKRDFTELETKLRHELEILRLELRDVERRMTIKLGALMVGAIGVVATLDKFLNA